MTTNNNNPEQAKTANDQAEQSEIPLAGSARLRKRHKRLILSFVIVVLLPLLVSTWYLQTRAQDQYISTVAFSVRSEDITASSDLFIGLPALGGGGSEDADILFEYIQSRELVSIVDKELNLREIYSRFKNEDPVFSYDPSGTIEDLTRYWNRMVNIFYDSSTGLIELRVHAFDPIEAQAIANSIYSNSTIIINELSAIAREDATRYAREELNGAVDRLKSSRQAVTEFRSRNQIVDPKAEIGAQTGLITALQTKLSDALIAYDLLKDSAGANDPRLAQAELRIEVIRQRIDEERLKYGATDSDQQDYSALVGEYERLAVDREFAERTYLAALVAFDKAQTEAQRKSKYLAAYIKPSLAERAEYPKKPLLLSLLGLFSLFAWSIGALIYYAIKDRR